MAAVSARAVDDERRSRSCTHSLWSTAQDRHGAADVRGVERMVEGDNPQAGRADRAPRALRLAHRDPVRGPVGTRRELGAALIEAAYVLPVFFLLIFGIMEIGLYMNDDLAVG